MQTGKIGVSAENIFPIIKQHLYSDRDIFLRELIANAIDATQKLKTLANTGEYKDELGDLTINVSVDKKNNKIVVSDRGIGMTYEEVDKYINQIAFSSAQEFIDKYKDKSNLIGHFGLGFYSIFMVAKKAEIYTKSYKDEPAVHWICEGKQEYSLEETEKEDRGTEIIMYLDDDSQEFLEEETIENTLKKYCRFLPIPISFGKKKEYKDGEYVETDEPNIINDTEPLWKKKPADLKDEDYTEFYKKLYPMAEDPLFHIHLNVDYPFNLTGILYFPKIKSNLDVQRNKIHLYCNQVYVTDSVEGIVPEFLTLLHGVIDSPDIPLNVSRSDLQTDANVKKISSHITKKVADRLNEIFKNNRKQFEEKWDDLKLFIEYGMLSDEKFYDRAKNFALLKNTEDQYYTFDEYAELIKSNQTDKHNNLIYLYATNKDEQYSFIQAAKDKGYDVLIMDGQLDTHFINQLEQKFENSRFVRVDADIVDNLIEKDEKRESTLSDEHKEDLRHVFESRVPENMGHFNVTFENMSENENPLVITQNEFMRRMKDMSQMTNEGMGIYGNLPDSYNLVVNSNHRLIHYLADKKEESVGEKVKSLKDELKPLQEEKAQLDEAHKDKKDEDIPQEEKDKKSDLENKINDLENQKKEVLTNFGKEQKLVKQLVDLALVANNMLKGEELSTFVRRSVELIK